MSRACKSVLNSAAALLGSLTIALRWSYQRKIGDINFRRDKMTSEVRAANMEDEAFAEEMTATSNVERPQEVSPDKAVQPTFAGLDAGSYPGPNAMTAFRSIGFSVTGLYLTHAPARSIPNRVDNGWISAADGLGKAGWGLAPIYVGAEPEGSSTVPPPDNPLVNAQVDADEAINLARRAGFEAGRTIFLDVEKAFPANSPFESYVLKWVEVVQTAGYGTALYCFPGQISWASAHGLKIWTVHLNRNTGTKKNGVITWSVLTSPLSADPIDSGAIGTQGRFYCHAANQNVELDYDRWLVADPSRLAQGGTLPVT
jgi:hypothetical protein